MRYIKKSLLAGMVSLAAIPAIAEVAVDGQIDYESTVFFNDSLNPNIDQNINNSISFDAEVYTEWANG